MVTVYASLCVASEIASTRTWFSLRAASTPVSLTTVTRSRRPPAHAGRVFYQIVSEIGEQSESISSDLPRVNKSTCRRYSR